MEIYLVIDVVFGKEIEGECEQDQHDRPKAKGEERSNQINVSSASSMAMTSIMAIVRINKQF